ncbi:nucleoside transporter NupC [Vibrio cholerae]|nr:nucleoside transporter NupC [Vibrio cholerae]
MSLFMSLIGMAVLLGIAVLLSSNRKAINLRTVGGAFAIQFSLGAFILYVPWGQKSYFVAFRMPYRMLLTTVTMVLHSSSVDWYQAKCLKCLAAAVSFSHSAYYQH